MSIGPALGWAVVLLLLFTVGERLCASLRVKRFEAILALVIALLIWSIPTFIYVPYAQWLSLGLLCPMGLVWMRMERKRAAVLPCTLVAMAAVVAAAFVLPRGRELLPISPIYIYTPLATLVALIAAQGPAAGFVSAGLGMLLGGLLLEIVPALAITRLGMEVFDAAMLCAFGSLVIKYVLGVLVEHVRRRRRQMRSAG